MNTNDKSTDMSPTPAAKRKPYIKPAFRYEKVFVTTALSCGKTPNSSFQCNSDPEGVVSSSTFIVLRGGCTRQGWLWAGPGSRSGGEGRYCE